MGLAAHEDVDALGSFEAPLNTGASFVARTLRITAPP